MHQQDRHGTSRKYLTEVAFDNFITATGKTNPDNFGPHIRKRFCPPQSLGHRRAIDATHQETLLVETSGCGPQEFQFFVFTQRPFFARLRSNEKPRGRRFLPAINVGRQSVMVNSV
jgi:hypothetical protein